MNTTPATAGGTSASVPVPTSVSAALGITSSEKKAAPAVQRSESIAKLAMALAKAQAQITFAAKDATNPHFKSKYADLAAVWEACRKPLSGNGLSVVQLPSTDGLKVTLTTVLMHESGEWISQDLTMTASANTPQAIGSCITYARRYALSSVAGIAQDDDDGNAASNKAVPK